MVIGDIVHHPLGEAATLFVVLLYITYNPENVTDAAATLRRQRIDDD